MSTAYIKNLIDYNGDIVYPQTKASAIYDDDGNLLSAVMAHKPTIVITTLAAANWDSDNKCYSFESTYPSATYDIEIGVNGDIITDEQLEAWTAAKPLDSQSNKINIKGTIPTVDIPVIITVVKK